MNLTQLRRAIYIQTGLNVNDGLVTPEVINSFVNRALHAYEAEGGWPWLQCSEVIPTVSGVDTYTPGAYVTNPLWDWNRTSELRVMQNEADVLEWKSPTELDDKWNFDDIGPPEDFTIFSDQIVLRPIPDGAYNILHRFERAEIDLVAETDVPTLPPQFHEVLVEYGSYLVFRRSRETERMQEALNAYNAWIAKMRARSLRRADLPGRVRVRPYGWL